MASVTNPALGHAAAEHAPPGGCMAQETMSRPSTPEDCIVVRVAADSSAPDETSRSDQDTARLGPRCRICLDAVTQEQRQVGDGVQLDCRCIGDAGNIHRECAERWFQRRQNLTCEVCNAPVGNVRLLPPLPGQVPHRVRRTSSHRGGRGHSSRGRRPSNSARRGSATLNMTAVQQAAFDESLVATRCLFLFTCAVAVCVCLYYLYILGANILLAIALSALCSTVYCSLGANMIVNNDHGGRLTPWLLFFAIAAAGWPIALALLISKLTVADSSPLTACTAGACVSVAIVFIHFKMRALCVWLVSICMGFSRRAASASALAQRRPSVTTINPVASIHALQAPDAQV